MITILSNTYLLFTKASVLEEKSFFAAIWKSSKKIHCWIFQIDGRVDARFATENIAFKVIMVMSNLLLLKPSWKSKSKVHTSPLERKMEHWESRKSCLELLEVAETIQKCLKTTNTTSIIHEISKKFNREIRRRNVNKAIKYWWITWKMVFSFNLEHIETLSKTVTQRQCWSRNIITRQTKGNIPNRVTLINAESVRKATLKTIGGKQPSRLRLKVRRS